MSAPSHIFVYGTLRAKSAHPMAKRLRRQARLIGHGYAPGRLYDLGWYPAAVFDENEVCTILGDVFAVKSGGHLLSELDAYEAGNPNYTRCALNVRLHDGRNVTAWAYGMHAAPRARLIPSGDFLSHWSGKQRRPKSS